MAAAGSYACPCTCKYTYIHIQVFRPTPIRPQRCLCAGRPRLFLRWRACISYMHIYAVGGAVGVGQAQPGSTI